MKKSIFALAACIMTTSVIFTGCNSSSAKVDQAQENVKQANRDLDQANREYLADMANYKKETEARIAANDQMISDMKAGMEHNKKSVKADYKKKMSALEQKMPK